MPKRLTETLIHRKRIGEGENQDVYIKDIPSDLLPTDIINIIRDEGFQSENNSWDAYTRLVITREREETDAEYEKRKLKNQEHKEDLKKRRYDDYVSLKTEFFKEDKELVNIYMSAFFDELDARPEKIYEDKLSSNAYKLGRNQAILGGGFEIETDVLLRQIRL